MGQLLKSLFPEFLSVRLSFVYRKTLYLWIKFVARYFAKGVCQLLEFPGETFRAV